MGKKKVLLIYNIIKKRTEPIEAKALNDLGFEVHMCANMNELEKNLCKEYIQYHHIDFERIPFNPRNIKAFKQVNQLIYEHNISIIHCHTPIGGLAGRICGKKYNVEWIIYTAHGFHFYKGAPLINRIIYKNIEKYLARKTNILITITKEDYHNALEFKKINKELDIFYIPGVGIDREKIIQEASMREELCSQLNISTKSFLILSAGELNRNKNQKVVIEAIANIKENQQIHYIVCGVGPLEKELKQLAIDRGVSENVHFLGYREDIIKLMKSTDLFVMPSYREGLSRAIMEAMAAGLPVICSKIRGNVDLINEQNGFLIEPKDIKEFSRCIELLCLDRKRANQMGKNSLIMSQQYQIESIYQNMVSIYKNEIEGKK